MPKDYSDHQEWEERGGRLPGKELRSTLKDYVIIALLAVLVFNLFAHFSPGGGCGMMGGGETVSAEQLRRLGLEYYAARYGDTAVEAQVRDFGCHREIYILKEGQLVLRLAHRGGELYALPEV